jgi:hypothetical protein
MCENLHNSIYAFFKDGDHIKLEYEIRLQEKFLKELALKDEILRSILPLSILLR